MSEYKNNENDPIIPMIGCGVIFVILLILGLFICKII